MSNKLGCFVVMGFFQVTFFYDFFLTNLVSFLTWYFLSFWHVQRLLCFLYYESLSCTAVRIYGCCVVSLKILMYFFNDCLRSSCYEGDGGMVVEAQAHALK